MNANERLSNAQSALKAQGVRDVKFFFAPEARSEKLSKVKEDAAKVLEAYLAGQHRAMAPFGDATDRI